MQRSIGRQKQQGLVLLAILVFILISSLGASAMVQMHVTQAKRDKEEQLLFVGDQFRRAISSYYNTFPVGAPRSLPSSLEDLLEDRRSPTSIHHLRRVYLDPMTGQADWHLVRAANGIVGVRSKSEDATVKKSGFSKPNILFEGKVKYSEWVFSIQL